MRLQPSQQPDSPGGPRRRRRAAWRRPALQLPTGGFIDVAGFFAPWLIAAYLVIVVALGLHLFGVFHAPSLVKNLDSTSIVLRDNGQSNDTVWANHGTAPPPAQVPADNSTVR